MGSSDQRGSTVSIVLALAVSAVAGVALAGPAQVGPARWSPTHGYRPQPLPTAEQASLPPKPLPEPDETTGHLMANILQIVLLVIVVAVAAAIVAALVRRFRPRRLVRRLHPGDADRIAALWEVTSEPVDAPRLVRGLARALEMVERPGRSDDAVIQAWLGVEDAATAAGAARMPSETAAEHARRIVARFETDRDAVDELLRLYQDVRFGGYVATGDDVQAALRCLRLLQQSWQDETGAAPNSAGHRR